MTKELVLTQKDFDKVSINLNQGDLVEIIATDIFEKLMNEVKEINENYNTNFKGYSSDMFPDKQKEFAKILLEAKVITQKEKIDYTWSGIKVINNWDYIGISSLKIDENHKSGGITIREVHIDFYYPKFSKEKTVIKIEANACEEITQSEFSFKGGRKISGQVDKTIEKKFCWETEVLTKRFRFIVDEIKDHNKRVKSFMAGLPEGPISVERLTRDARVKINKSVLKMTAPDFREKLCSFFNIRL